MSTNMSSLTLIVKESESDSSAQDGDAEQEENGVY